MMAFGLKMLGWGKTIARIMRAALRWIFADWVRVAMVLALAAAVLLFTQRNDAREGEARWQAASEKNFAAARSWRQAHARLIIDTQSQRAVAARLDQANAARVQAELAQVKERTAHAYEARLADTAAALGSLQSRLVRTAAGDSGGRDAAGGSALTARCQAFGAADCDTLLAALPGQLAAAERNTAALIGLQEYTCAMLATDWGNAKRETFAADVVEACAGHGIILPEG
jgi:hypothetical protein